MKKNQKEALTKIRAKYTPSEKSELDRLVELDKKISRPATALAYVLGGLGALILGAGMSLIMTDLSDKLPFIADSFVTGVILGSAGLAVTLANYPVYLAFLSARKKKHSKEVIELCDGISEK